MAYDTLTDEQQKLVQQVDQDAQRAFDAARDKLTTAGLRSELDDLGCLRCGCDGWSGRPNSCDTCGHSIFVHGGV